MLTIALIFAYLMIGLFVSSFMEEWTSGHDFRWAIILWPALIAGGILFGVFALPSIFGKKLAEWIGQL